MPAEAEERSIPRRAVREAVREFVEAGEVRRARGRKTGREPLAPLARMGERELDTLLLGVMPDTRNGILVPDGSELARKVEGFRKAQAERRTARQTEEVEAQAEQPVEA